MINKYVSFITDEHLLTCIGNLYASYLKAKKNISRKKFYSNKIDIFKLTFDAKFNELDEKTVIENEIMRQIDKSINNSIGTFHEQILGGVAGYEIGNYSGFDLKAEDNTLFADIKNKHNTMNSSSAESLFQKLARYADNYKSAKCYWVQILAKKSFDEHWAADINGKEYSHSRVFKISGDRFYETVTGEKNALFNLYKALPAAIEEVMNNTASELNSKDSAAEEIFKSTEISERTVFNQITFDNFPFYAGFEDL